MKKVACVGILVADVIVEKVTKYPDKGVLLPVNSITLHNGGNAMTASINMKKLGVDTYMVGKVGSDVFGDYLCNRLNEYGVNTSGLKRDKDVQTSASVLMIDESGERSFFHCVGTNAVFSVSDIDYSVIDNADIVFVTGSFLMDRFDGEETAQFLKECKARGKTTFLDVCWDAKGNWGKKLDMAMPYLDWLMPSIDEAVNIAEEQEPEKIADVFMAKGVKNVVIKMGSKGAFVRCEGEKQGTMYPSFKGINVVDTTGAGDSFCSGFIASFARDKKIPECAVFANATGAHSVMAKGATTGITSYDEIKKFAEERKNACNS